MVSDSPSAWLYYSLCLLSLHQREAVTSAVVNGSCLLVLVVIVIAAAVMLLLKCYNLVQMLHVNLLVI